MSPEELKGAKRWGEHSAKSLRVFVDKAAKFPENTAQLEEKQAEKKKKRSGQRTPYLGLQGGTFKKPVDKKA